MKLYLSGPMTGLPNDNFPAFEDAGKRWRAAGHEVMCPATTSRGLGYADGGSLDARRHYILIDVLCLAFADAIVLLPGWERSLGAIAELAVAQFLGLEVYDAATMERWEPVNKPWHSLER